uniref:histidine--tRNA ligase n=1 Tax=Steinernema glaseri TaxID=37863 RepID=A0A1I7YL23_9BILA
MWATFFRRSFSTTPAASPVIYSHRSGAKQKKKGNASALKTPRGTRDFLDENAHRKSTIRTIEDVFKCYGGTELDTPVYELTDVLLGKYGGEANKLVYDLVENDGERCSLRYDLTVPFARYLAMNRVSKMRRYQIGKVYRREKPVMTKGRYCEFHQCDFDIAGVEEPMLPDAECLSIVDEVVKKLDLGSFTTRVNHRSLLEAVLLQCGVPVEAIQSVCCSIDKLDKEPWKKVSEELRLQNNIPSSVVSELERFITFEGENTDMIKLFREKVGGPQATASIQEMEVLFDYCNAFGVNVTFDPSLARGLDYYTGMIFETVLEDGACGSIAAGGRYDNLVHSLTSETRKPFSVPCVGLSIGIERIFSLLEQKKKNTKEAVADVFVASPQKSLLLERISVWKKLRDAGIKAQFERRNKSKFLDQLQFCEANDVKLAVIIGEQESKEGVLKLRNVATREETIVPEGSLIDEIQKRLVD